MAKKSSTKKTNTGKTTTKTTPNLQPKAPPQSKITVNNAGKVTGGLNELQRTLKAEIQRIIALDGEQWRGDIDAAYNTTFEQLTKDGSFSAKDQVALQKALKGAGVGFRKLAAADYGVGNTLSQIRYDDFLGSQTDRFDAFVGGQSSRIDEILQAQQSDLQQQLGGLKAMSSQALNSFTSQLGQSDRQFQQIMGGQRAGWSQANQESLAAIKRYQSRIASVPDFTPVKQISGGYSPVVGPGTLQNFSVQQQPIQLQRTPARTGLSMLQRNSMNRQRQGIEGLRRL
jgi:hypothetical protein